jgi:hypothetical protein
LLDPTAAPACAHRRGARPARRVDYVDGAALRGFERQN